MAAKNLHLIRIAVCLLIAVTACTVASKPTVVINSPASGSEFQDGEVVAIQSTAADATGIVRVELIVDNIVVRTDASPTPQGQATLTLIQTWKATPGNHTIVVRAYNVAGAMSDPVGVALSILSNPSPGPTSIAVLPTTVPVVPSITPAGLPPTVPSSSSSSVTSASCVNDAAFVADVTVPDGTNFVVGQTFNKIWRLSNSGSCAWGAGYQFVFVSGTAMTASTINSAPITSAGATVDMLVPMTAPTSNGSYTGVWRMRAPNGSFFGKSVTVKITVVGGVLSSSSSASSSASSSVSGCVGQPNIASFTGSTASIPAATTITVASGTGVTLSWGLVSNADAASIDQDIGGIETPGSKTVNPTSTTTYTLTATCGANTKTAQVKVNVTLLGPPIMLVYDFIAKANVAGDNWQSTGSLGSFNLPFPGSDVDNHGFALWRDNYKLNDGSQPARVLETHPQWTANGSISRCYHDLWNSGYKVQASDSLSAKVGFLQGAGAGDVTFRIRLRTDSFPNNDVSVTHLVYADGVKSINVALGTLNSGQYVGHQADICLIVEAGASASQDWAVWQDVRISR